MAYLRIDYYSTLLDMTTDVIVTFDETIDIKKAPVILLLHGLGDNASGWSRYTRCEFYAREHGAILIMPEVQRSFYMDMDNGLKYFSYLTKELPSWIKKTFRFSGDWYVMGLSMGGYGAMKCALSRPGFFKGCGAFSSVADINFWFDERKNNETLGIRREIRKEDDLFYLFTKAKKPLPLFLSCGTEDRLFDSNRRLSEHIKNLGMNPEIYFVPGIHSWRFWDESLYLALNYFLGKVEER